jgi:outer membrane protein TolC
MAAANCGEARALLLEAQAERHKTAVDTGWRNPQLRMGRRWGDQDEETPGRSGMRTYPDEVDMPSRPFTRYREWEEQTFDGETVGLRVYTANPFVNRWLRKRGEAAARALEKESEEEAYAVYCEVRTLCLEAELLREEADLLERMAGLRQELRDVRREQVEAGVTTPLDLIRAETRLAALRSELGGKRMARQQLVRRIAVLAGVPAEGFKLRPKAASRPDAAALDPAVLADLAFARRPDLARLEREREAAEHAVKAARAGQIPWFEYVEGTYEDGRAEIDSYETYFTGHDSTTRKETEWQVRVAVTVPVFNWLGDEIKLTRTQLAAAEARVQGQYEMVRTEVGGVLEDYRAASVEWERLAGEGERLRETMTARLDALAREPTVQPHEVLEAREELLAYQRVCLKAERECLFMAQCLETVSGGALAPGDAAACRKTH